MIETAPSRSNRVQPGRLDAPRFAIERETIAGTDWTIAADCAEALLGPDGLRWDEWGRAGALQTVKTGPHRTVYRLTLPAGTFYVKHFRVADWKALLRNLVRDTPAEREWRAAQRIAELGLPTFAPAALGVTRHVGIACDSYLISREIPRARSLDEFLTSQFLRMNSSARATLRQHLAVMLGRFAARLHAAGIEHVDLHAANLLIDFERDGLPELTLIDLHAVRFRESLSPRQTARNLGALHQFFAARSTRSDRLRFYRAYRTELWMQAREYEALESDVGASHPLALDRQEITALEETLAAAAQNGWRRADRAWRRGNRHVRRVAGPGWRGRALASLDAAWVEAVCRSPERLFEDPSAHWLKRTDSCRVAETSAPPECGAGRVIWKCAAGPDHGIHLLERFRDSRARRAWEVGLALFRRAIDTPRPLLYVETRSAGMRRDYLLTEAVPGALSVPDFLRHVWPDLAPSAQREWLHRHGRRLAVQLARMHACGFDHRDLKFSNLLVSNDPADPRTWLVDLDGVRVWMRLPRPRAVQNLSRLAVSSLLGPAVCNGDRLRFLKWYLADEFESCWKNWWRAIARRSKLKQQRNARAGRALS